MDYYNTYYQHYRLCQRAACADAHRQDDGSITYTKDDFDAGLGRFLSDWASQEGKIRLLLPSQILSLHEESIEVFNQMKAAVFKFKQNNETRKLKTDAFKEVEQVKTAIERSLRDFLRTEKLLK